MPHKLQPSALPHFLPTHSLKHDKSVPTDSSSYAAIFLDGGFCVYDERAPKRAFVSTYPGETTSFLQ
ncbi:MAG: hypothetical protein ACM3TU_02610 [Bacillota bacterium]